MGLDFNDYDNRSNHTKSYLRRLRLLFYYSFYSFIAIGRIAAIARFNFIRSILVPKVAQLLLISCDPGRIAANELRFNL